MTNTPETFRQNSDIHHELFKELVAYIESRTFVPPFGEIQEVSLDALIPEEEYQNIDFSILQLFDRGLILTLIGLPFCDYYKIQRFKRKKSIKRTFKYIFKYYCLFRSLKQKDYVVSQAHLKSYPWLFMAKNLTLRLDGHHRSAVSRFLGKTSLPAMVITHRSFNNQNIPETLKFILQRYDEAELSTS